MKAAGLILAAGAGTRFGAPTKQLADLRGKPLLQHAVDTMNAALERTVVVLGHDADAIRARIDFGGAAVVVCDDWAQGQGFSLRAGVAALADADAVAITLGDQPFITPRVITDALAQLDGYDAVRALYDGAPGHPVVLGAAHGRRPRARGRRRRARAARPLPGPLGGRAAGERDRRRHPGGAGAAVRLDLSFDVAAPIDAVWPALNDLDQVAPCLPGAALTGEADSAYHGEFTLKVGPFATVHRGTIRIEAADDAARVQRLALAGWPSRRDDRQHALGDRRRHPCRRRRQGPRRRPAGGSWAAA